MECNDRFWLEIDRHPDNAEARVYTLTDGDHRYKFDTYEEAAVEQKRINDVNFQNASNRKRSL